MTLDVRLEPHPDAARVLADDAVAFVVALHQEFESRRQNLLGARRARQRRLDAGERPNFLPSTAAIRAGDWRVAPAPKDLLDRRVEITGPVERKMMINALNSGARVFMADFEDATSPTWDNVVRGQRNVYDAVRRTITHTQGGKTYQLHEATATLMLRPRGWHLDEKHLVVDGQAVSASLFDFGLAVFHNARAALESGSGPYFYLPKLEGHLEARLWHDVFCFAEDRLGIDRGSIRATVLIETILAAFEMDEILYELREHIVGLNAGRWDYIFSVAKKFAQDSSMVLPDRADITMTTPFMRAYTELLVKTCHARGAHAIGGMAAFIPNRHDPEVTQAAIDKVRADKRREAADGCDGTWVAHPDLVAIAREEFDAVLGERPNQLDRQRPDVHIEADDLLAVARTAGAITEAGVRVNVDVGLRYLEAWLSGTGAAAIHNLMEDAATAEISRAQLWQWVRHKVKTTQGTVVDPDLVRRVIDDELAKRANELGAAAFAESQYRAAREIFEQVALGEHFVDFLTVPAYARLA